MNGAKTNRVSKNLLIERADEFHVGCQTDQPGIAKEALDRIAELNQIGGHHSW